LPNAGIDGSNGWDCETRTGSRASRQIGHKTSPGEFGADG
jgi:hypothetical protein